ncbi:MAG: alpha/beta hydrolase [Hyphomonadaceae bacterium]|nr:alpha/beta hydrolase [Hyphomonadaceae bacterium]
MLFVHGWAAKAAFFAAQIEAFAPITRVIAPDLAGHGGARDAGGLPTIAGMADDVAALLDALDLTGVLAVGWSMGASVLWALAARAGPSRIAGLVSVDMTPRVLNDETWSLGLADGLTQDDSVRAVEAMRADWRKFAERVAGNIFAPDASPALHARYGATAFADNDPDAMAHAWTSLTAFDARPLIPAIDAPTLVAYGARSKLYAPATSAWLADTAPNAARIAFHRSGHAPHLEEPERFNRMLSEFAAILTGKDATRDVKQLGRAIAAVT